MVDVARFSPVGLLTLREIRGFIRRSSARGGVVFFGLLYVLGSLFLGGMVVLGHLTGGTTVLVLWGSATGQGSWNYPGLLIEAPWGVVSLPFFATFAMLVVAIGVGYGMTVAFLLAAQLVLSRARNGNGASAGGAIAGLTPALISLVTLGACCSTTAAATAGVGVVALASGTSVSNLLLNNWYLGVFQIVVVWVALVGQEMLLVVYTGLFGAPSLRGTAAGTQAISTPRPRPSLLGILLRVILLGAGVVWALAVLAEWTTVDPSTAGPGLWFQWIVQHELLAGFAIGAALFPAATFRLLEAARARLGLLLPALLVVGGLTLLLWVPPPLPASGVDGLVNQVLGALGAPASWGAIAPGAASGFGLYVRWGFEYVLLGGFAVSAVVAPSPTLRLLGESGSPFSSTEAGDLGRPALSPPSVRGTDSRASARAHTRAP
jgi:hypothetical protein